MADIIPEDMLNDAAPHHHNSRVRIKSVSNTFLKYFETPAANQLDEVPDFMRVLTEATSSFFGLILPCLIATLVHRYATITWPYNIFVIPLSVIISSLLQFVVVGRYIPETHGNPVITIASLISKPPLFLRRQAYAYWLGQILGAFAAVGLIRAGFIHGHTCPTVCHVKWYWCAIAEFIFALFMSYVRCRLLASNKYFRRRVPIMAGLLGGLSLGGGYVSGPSLSPIRYAAPAIMSNSYGSLISILTYLICPVLGGVMGGFASWLHGEIPDLSPLPLPQQRQAAGLQLHQEQAAGPQLQLQQEQAAGPQEQAAGTQLQKEQDQEQAAGPQLQKEQEQAAGPQLQQEQEQAAGQQLQQEQEAGPLTGPPFSTVSDSDSTSQTFIG